MTRPMAPVRARRFAVALSVLAATLVLAGCSTTGSGTARTDESRSAPGARGITVFGDLDAGVRRERSR